MERDPYFNELVQEGSSEILKKIVELEEKLYKWVKIPKRENWMDIVETIQYTTLSDSSIRRAVRKGELKASRKTGKLLFQKEAIDKWLKSNPKLKKRSAPF
tara:strand:+ start:227 stop:529 length:303 start_codon:yes stop_codon:yes gene_type:complete